MVINRPSIQAARLTKSQMIQCLDKLRSSFDTADVISRRDNRIVVRWRRAESQDSIIIKMWSRPDMNGALRRLLRIAACNHEWRNLVRMHACGIAVPTPLGLSAVVPSIGGYTDVLFMEDLGVCESASDFLKRLVRTGEHEKALDFENMLIKMTVRIVDAGMLDVDHGVHNIVVPPSGKPVKLDVELGRRVIWPALFPNMYAKMLGRMIGMHAFSVQPDTAWTTRFSQRLGLRLRTPQRILKQAGVLARAMLQKQYRKTGIDTQLILPWD